MNNTAVPQRCEVAVVGAGIAGLAAAWELRDRAVVVLESEPRVGGRLWSEPRGDYWLNLGGHVLGGPDSATGHLLASLGMNAIEVPGALTALAFDDQFLWRGIVETYPLRLDLPLADRLSMIRAGARLRAAVARYARATRPRAGEPSAARRMRVLGFDAARTFADWLGPVPKSVDGIFRATIQRSSGEPEDVTAGYGIGYFQLVWDRSGGLTRNIPGGSARLPERIGEALRGHVWTGRRVSRISEADRGVDVTYVHDGQEQTLRTDYVVVACPAPAAREIAVVLPAQTRNALSQITYGSYVAGAFLTSEADAMPYDGVYAAATPGRSFNMLFNMASTLRSGPRMPGGSLMVYSGARLAARLWDLADDEVKQIYADDLTRLFPSLKGRFSEIEIRRWRHGLPHPRPGRERIQAALEAPPGRVMLAGDYLGTTYIDTAIQTGLEAAQRIRRELPVATRGREGGLNTTAPG